MVAGFTFYVDPNSYISEVVVPSGINIPALPFAVCLVGTGSRNKRVVNEQVLRGIVSAEALSPAGSSPHVATLANRGDRRLDNTVVRRTLNGISSEVLDQFLSYNPAFVLGTVTGTVDLSTATALNAFALETDGIDAVTMVMHPTLTYAAASTFITVVSGSTVTISRATSTFLTDGIRPGATLTLALSEDSPDNNGAYTVTAVASQTSLTAVKNSGTPITTSVPPDSTVTIAISGTGAVGREIHSIHAFSGALGAAATITEIADSINTALSSTVGTTLGFGSDYADFASVSGSALLLTSQLSTPTSDVEVFAPIGQSALIAIFGAAGPSNRSAQTRIVISDLIWNASATWEIDYVELVAGTDPLSVTANIQRIIAVGSSPGTTNFAEFTDWTLSGDEVSWAAATSAYVTGIGGISGVAPDLRFDLSTNDHIVVGLDGLVGQVSASVDMDLDLVGMVDPPIGYTAPVSAAATSVDEMVVNVNALLAAELGPRYATAASRVTVGSTYRLRITSPITGQAASAVYIKAPLTLSATALVFGGELYPPSGTGMGTGKSPAVGSLYYVTYEYTRPATDYEIPFRFFDPETAKAQVGQVDVAAAAYNPLAIGAEIAFENGAQFIYTVQIDDLTEGNPTRAQVKAALDGAGTIAGTTEIIIVGEPGTRLDVTTDEIDHLEVQNGPVEKHPRRIFCAMENDTSIGDRDTVDSIVGRASRTLQVAATSPGRGRMFLVAPPQQAGVTRNLVFEDGSEARISLDATYLSVAVAARRTSLSGPAETLTGKTITGFNTDDITAPWKPAERRTMAGQGVFVITYDAGLFKMKDALSTESAGGGLVQFTVDSTSYQKDIITTKVNQALEANIVGIVPFDLASFILDIKLVIQGVVAQEISRGTIGPFRDRTTGVTRSIDLRTDIRVAQSTSNPTEYNFAYWYFLRYPALRLFGSYSVDAPFFALAA